MENNKPIVYVSRPQTFVGAQWIAIFANEPDVPTLWIYYGDDMPANEKQECEQYAEKIAALISKDALQAKL